MLTHRLLKKTEIVVSYKMMSGNKSAVLFADHRAPAPCTRSAAARPFSPLLHPNDTFCFPDNLALPSEFLGNWGPLTMDHRLNKQAESSRCCFNAGPPSATVAQH